MNPPRSSITGYVAAIRASGFSIYDTIEIGSPTYIPSPELEQLLSAGLQGFSTVGMPLRTRSKAVKARVCEVLGYPVPTSFKRTKPKARFPGQNFDTYIQKSNNLQIWNEGLLPTRRYILIREEHGILTRVRVVTGEMLAELDTTGTLTQKYQARFVTGIKPAEAISKRDTQPMVALLALRFAKVMEESPTDYPQSGGILPIAVVFKRLSALIDTSFPDLGRDQERNRGAALHRLVCGALGYQNYADDGRFPDVKHQLVEVKLQTSPTIDLGWVTPDSTEPLDIPKTGTVQLRHCDVRYALFDAVTDGTTVTIRGFYLTTGEDFFSRFPRFGGKVLNRKLQIRLPARLFEAKSLTNVTL